jgi:NAD(P)-dependent dehydrogenase (short-subunit alcohol dehydrogenase family)
MTARTPRHWLITGASSGFGRELAKAALARGDTVVGTLRRQGQATEFEALAPGRAHAVLLDVTETQAVRPAVREAIRRAGHIDVLVNNAGYGFFGAAEETADAEARHLMETNFFGVLAVTQALLPHLRERKRGHVLNVSSLAGVTGLPGCGLYCASKFALEGLSESLALELAPLGIRVTIVEPGGFRTNFAGGSLRVAGNPLADYNGTPAGLTRDNIAHYHGNEPGDPAKAAAALLQAVDAEEPPLRLVLGRDAVAAARRKIDALRAQVAAWETVSVSTDFEPATA